MGLKEISTKALIKEREKKGTEGREGERRKIKSKIKKKRIKKNIIAGIVFFA